VYTYQSYKMNVWKRSFFMPFYMWSTFLLCYFIHILKYAFLIRFERVFNSLI
jgi:hypothetical protein